MLENYEINDSMKEDYLIFDGIELMKDADYYEYVDQYKSDSDSYFDIKKMFDDKKFDEYIDRLKSDKHGFFNFNRFAMMFSSRPDYYNRLTIFGA